MRVKLSYTVDEEDVLQESAKLLGLVGSDLQHVAEVFNAVQSELRLDSSEKVVNINKCYEMIDEVREAILNVDTRFMEVREIVSGYDEYQRIGQEALAVPPEHSQQSGEDKDEE